MHWMGPFQVVWFPCFSGINYAVCKILIHWIKNKDKKKIWKFLSVGKSVMNYFLLKSAETGKLDIFT